MHTYSILGFRFIWHLRGHKRPAVFYSTVSVVEMSLEPIGYGSFGLSYILLVTCETCDYINQVGTFATDIGFAGVFQTCDMAGDFTCLVQKRAISAFFVIADIWTSFGPYVA